MSPISSLVDKIQEAEEGYRVYSIPTSFSWNEPNKLK